MPSFPFASRKAKAPPAAPPPARLSHQTVPPQTEAPISEWQLHRATRTRKAFTLLASFFLLTSVVFLLLVETGNTHPVSMLRSTYFVFLDLSQIQILSSTVANTFDLVNSIPQTIGLHDFYQVGLWNYCEGNNNGVGITHCSAPEALFWFNPVAVLESQLVAGASGELPSCTSSCG